MNRSRPGWRHWGTAIAAAILAFGVACIVATYNTFDQTWDEGAHIAGGMEWLDRGTYTYEVMHTPVARIAVALGPYLAGARSHGNPNWWTEGNLILGSGARYHHLLVLARLAILPFFLLAGITVYVWTRKLHGVPAALIATLLYATTPPILAQASIATTDMAVTAMITLALYRFWLWLKAPSAGNGAALGAAAALAIGSKLSALVFLPAAFGALLLARRAGRSLTSQSHGRRSSALWALGSGALVLWAVYRFSVGPILPPHGAEVLRGATRSERTVIAMLDAPIYPAPELARGVAQLAQRNAVTKKNYLFGTVRSTGRWEFFPVAIAVKSPLPLLILAAAGVGLAFGRLRWSRSEACDQLAPAAAALAIVLIAMPADLNIGVRHILPVYPLLVIVAGIAGARLLDSGRRLSAVTVGVLLLWQAGVVVRAHPDYIAYFNPLAGSRPEHVLVDGDLDTGQDLKRMSAELRRRAVDSVWIAYAGSRELTQAGLPPFRLLPPRTPVTGWIAISMYKLYLGPVADPAPDGYAWLRSLVPVARVGRSMALYHVP